VNAVAPTVRILCDNCALALVMVSGIGLSYRQRGRAQVPGPQIATQSVFRWN